MKSTIPKKVPVFFSRPKKIPVSFIDPKKTHFAKTFRPKKISKICEWNMLIRKYFRVFLLILEQGLLLLGGRYFQGVTTFGFPLAASEN